MSRGLKKNSRALRRARDRVMAEYAEQKRRQEAEEQRWLARHLIVYPARPGRVL